MKDCVLLQVAVIWLSKTLINEVQNSLFIGFQRLHKCLFFWNLIAFFSYVFADRLDFISMVKIYFIHSFIHLFISLFLPVLASQFYKSNCFLICSHELIGFPSDTLCITQIENCFRDCRNGVTQRNVRWCCFDEVF